MSTWHNCDCNIIMYIFIYNNCGNTRPIMKPLIWLVVDVLQSLVSIPRLLSVLITSRKSLKVSLVQSLVIAAVEEKVRYIFSVPEGKVEASTTKQSQSHSFSTQIFSKRCDFEGIVRPDPGGHFEDSRHRNELIKTSFAFLVSSVHHTFLVPLFLHQRFIKISKSKMGTWSTLKYENVKSGHMLSTPPSSSFVPLKSTNIFFLPSGL